MRSIAAGLLLFALAACPGGTTTKTGTFTIGGSVTGLTEGTLLLSNNGADPLTVRQSGRFTFAAALNQGDRYEVRIVTQPTTLVCAVASGSGVVGTSSVSSVAITCQARAPVGFFVGGTLSGLEAGNGNVILQQGTEQISVSANGNFKFANRVAPNASYTVSVATAPAGYICAVNRSSGVITTSDVTDVQVSCTRPTYSVSGSVLGASGPLTLTDGNVDLQIPSGQTSFEFDGYHSGDLFGVTVPQPPTGQDCGVSNGSGPITNANVTNIVVNCKVKTYSVSGAINNNTGSVTITNNNTDNIVLGASDKAFSFDGLQDGAPYSISISSLPPGENCTIDEGTPSGNIASKSVVDLVINCYQVTQYNLSGTVQGATGDVKIQNGNNSTIYTVHTTDSGFTIKANESSNYNVIVTQAPANQVCTVANGSGTNLIGNVSNIVVTCTTLSVIGTVTGNTNTTVSNPNSLILSVSKNGALTRVAIPAAASDVSFGVPGYVTGQTWSVDVYNSPAGLKCVKGGTPNGTVGNANVTGVTITCSPTTYNLVVEAVWANKTEVTGLWGGNTCNTPSSCPNQDSCSNSGICQDTNVNWVSDSNSGTLSLPCGQNDNSYLGIPGIIPGLKDGETVTLSLPQQPSQETCVFSPSDKFVVTRGLMAGARLVCILPCYPTESGCH